MPTPIPEWDRPRILIRYLVRRQLRHRTTNLQEARLRVGIGSDRILEILSDQGIEYKIVQTTEVKKSRGLEVLIKSVPESLAEVYRIDKEKLKDSFDILEKRDIKIEPERNWRKELKQKREQDRKNKLRYFLKEDI